MTPMDWFILFLALLAMLLICGGVSTLTNRRLEMAALAGAYPLIWGVGIGALAAMLFCIQHLSIRIV